MADKKASTREDLINQAIKDYKADNPDWRKDTREQMYSIESYIDALLYEKKFSHIAPGYGSSYFSDSTDEVILERLTFEAIKKMSGRRHHADPSYDEAFNGYDCMSEVIEHAGKDHKQSKRSAQGKK